MKKNNLIPVGKYINNYGEDGTRYVWEIDGCRDYYLESGAFSRRTKLGVGTRDEHIKAYTTSVSLGCGLEKMKSQCKFCVTGNRIPFGRFLSSREIALQNVFMVLDENAAFLEKEREFAYMGQGEPGLSYKSVKEAIIGTDIIMGKLGIKTYRHIFATAGIPSAIKKLTDDIKNSAYINNKILLHISLHSVRERGKIMPVNDIFPLQDVVDATKDYSHVTDEKVVMNFILFKNAILSGIGPITNSSEEEIICLTKILDPKIHRIILCEYNLSSAGVSEEITAKEVGKIERVLREAGFEVKRFAAFGKKDNLACGLLGGKAEPNLSIEEIKEKLKQANNLVNKYVKNC